MSAEPHLSEKEFLAREQADAKAALASSFEAIKSELAAAADPRKWARRYPWATVGAALAAGVAIAGALIPRKGETLGEKLSRSAESIRGGHHASTDDESEAKAAARPAILSILMSGLFELAKIGVQSAIRAQREAARQARAAEQRPPAADDEPVTHPTHPR